MDKSQLAGSLIRSYYVTYMSLVSLVSIVFALGAAGGVFSRCWTRGLDDVEKKSLLQFLLYLLLPFPILVFALYVTSLLIRNEFMEYWSKMMTL